ncbi:MULTISPECIES: DUF2303 family protein [Mycolicibacterium]|jgi:hypothetical protein|uniref:DUF2303 family protein n=3 Tax=Mycolicibacterium TaxID=1866885 RepID=A0AAE5AG86_MYCFO|nr:MULTISPECIES: DUF2303 family protein [Mycolicibacterium]KLI04539.1 hypothetical protein AA982_29585 [Mycolicibacterium senegalense]KLO53817.1 hypothetical protein ABW05_22345 [Mycolicibacterium senegalense]KMV16371.1 hypothetical protein ACT17_20620 [Mycolicibacterium conceptionense]MDV7194326.1 DUF2303 family protein [Mycolicibacterium fortuitum]MDV7294255.1 DUF2303 family protein [Mycolicibacterium fortuitum]
MTDANLETIAAAELGYYAPHVILETLDSETPNVRHVVGINEDRELQHVVIDEGDLQAIPRRAKGTRTVADVESFIAELARRPLTNIGTMWGNAHRGELSAIYNDHDTIESKLGGWRDDVLRLVLQQDPDWVAWHKISGKYYPQVEFGDVVEELRHTIQSPDQADLLEIIDSIRASTKGEFESSITRANGAQTLAYKKEVTSRAGAVGRELEVPEHIILSLRPWEGHPKLYEVPAYFRLIVSEGDLRLAIKLFPTREIVRQAWADLTAQIVEAVGKPVYAQP